MSVCSRQRNATLRLLPVLAAVLCTVVAASCEDQQVPTCNVAVDHGRQLEGEASGRRLKQDETKENASEMLWKAAVIGDKEAAEDAIKRNASLESRHGPFNNTPIIAASREGHDMLVELLVNESANVNALAEDNVSSLFLAAQFGHTDVVNVLIAGKADVNITRASYGDSPLFVASQSGHREVVEVLIDAGADVNATDLDGNSALHIAAEKGNDAIVKALLGGNATVGQKNRQGVTPLHLACVGAEGTVVQTLLDAGADMDARANDSSTPLLWAAWFGNLAAVKVLTENSDGELLPVEELASVEEQVCKCREVEEAGRPDDKALLCPDSTCEDDGSDLAQLRDLLKNGNSVEDGGSPRPGG